MKRFVMYRKGDLSKTHDENQVNSSDEPQFEGVIFSDGTVVVKWLTKMSSVSIWKNFDDLMAIHGHPEYDSELIWLDKENTSSLENK